MTVDWETPSLFMEEPTTIAPSSTNCKYIHEAKELETKMLVKTLLQPPLAKQELTTRIAAQLPKSRQGIQIIILWKLNPMKVGVKKKSLLEPTPTRSMKHSMESLPINVPNPLSGPT